MGDTPVIKRTAERPTVLRAAASRGGHVYRLARQRILASRQLERVAQADAELGPPIAKALADAISSRLSAKERELVDRIESLRARLNAIDRPITIVDHGIGSPDQEVDDRTAYEGRLVEWRFGELCRTRSMPAPWPLVLFELVRALGAERCVELGACMGISTAYQAAALVLNGSGKVVSIEASETLAEIARETLAELELTQAEIVIGLFQDRLDDVLRAQAPVDLAFIDGHHERKATVEYFEQTLGFASERAVLVFDDIHWSRGMSEAWSEIQRHPRVAFSVDLGKLGFSVLGTASSTIRTMRVDVA